MLKFIPINTVSDVLDLSLVDINKLISAGELKCVRSADGNQRITIDSITQYQSSIKKKICSKDKKAIDIRICVRDEIFYGNETFVNKIFKMMSCTRILKLEDFFDDMDSKKKRIFIIDDIYMSNSIARDIYLKLKGLNKLEETFVVIAKEIKRMESSKSNFEKYPNFFEMQNMSGVGWISGFVHALSLNNIN